jgi:hypothetical protein
MSTKSQNQKLMSCGITIALLICALVSAGSAQVSNNAPGFDTIGFIQSATVETVADPLSGGTITLNGHRIIVPRNTVVQMPAATIGWGEVFTKAPSFVSQGGTATGMAIQDCATACLPATFEARVQGNIVNGTYIAGLVFLSQQSLNVSQGYISKINYTDGSIEVNGLKVQINDPVIDGLIDPTDPTRTTGRHSKGQSPDVRFTVDQDNPTIRSETGYPMCIPRMEPTVSNTVPPVTTEDARCPQRNRPKNGASFIYNFTMDTPRADPTTPADLTKTDPWEQIPFEVGDFVSYAGVLQRDGTVSAYQIIGNLGAYTAPGTNPAYIGIDVILQGVGGVPNPNFPQEATAKLKVEGFSTDETRNVDILAIDVNCSGTASDRAPFVSNFVVDPGPPTGAVRGRWRFRPTGGSFLPPTSLVRARVSGYTGYRNGNRSANGLLYGQYTAPDFDFIFPENLGIGGPIPANNFADFVWLVNGIGPLGGDTNHMVGQLDPWPDLVAPPKTCNPGDPVPPTLTASFTATPNPVVVNNPITFDASAALDSGATRFIWTPAITCANVICSVGSFTPRTVPTGGILNFTLNVTRGTETATSTVPVTVTPAVPPTDVVTITSVEYRQLRARLTITATSSIVQASPAGCTVTNILPGCMLAKTDTINPATKKPYMAVMSNGGGGTYTVILNGLPLPKLVTVISGNKGSATSGVTVLRP